jgi:hypothetical protein
MDNIKLRSDKQLMNDKRLSEFFRNYHKKIKELKEKENIDTDKKEEEVVKEKKKRVKKSKKTSEPVVIIESGEEKYLINI